MEVGRPQESTPWQCLNLGLERLTEPKPGSPGGCFAGITAAFL